MQNATIPVTLLTGFLGAGKTTLLNRLLKGEHGLRVAVLVNDFGSINIDEMLIRSVDGNVITLEGGCTCCSLTNDLVVSLRHVASLAPDHIVLEASGIANPYSIIRTIERPALRGALHLEGVVTLVDAAYLPSARALNGRIDARDLIVDQISVADIVIANKIDLVTAEEREETLALARQIAPWARLVEASYADVPLDLVLGMSDEPAPRAPRNRPNAQAHPPHPRFDTLSVRSDRPVRLEALRDLLGRLPRDVLRAKGVLKTVDHPDERVIVQQVGSRITFAPGGPWGERARDSQLVLIGLTGSLDKMRIEAALQACLA